MSIVNNLLTAMFGSQHERDLKRLMPILHEINSLEPWAMGLKAEQFKEQTAELKSALKEGSSLDDILPKAFALAREAARRVLGERPYDVQILGALALHQGKIMEMKTGEGKTLSSVPAAYLNSLTEKGVHIITVNDYLAERDANWMKPIYQYLGLDVGFIISNMDNVKRKEAYQKDLTYGTNNEFGFDYLRDNMARRMGDKVQKEHHYCIIDEIDSILIDEARTPLIISGQADDDTAKFKAVNRVVNLLSECKKDPETGDYPEEPEGDFKLEEKNRRVSFTEEGMNKIEEVLQKNGTISGSLIATENFEYLHYVTQAVRAHKLYQRDVDYVVQQGKVEIVDEFTGRILHGRRYSEGLHQAIEAKEGIQVARRNRTLATITFQNFFRMYDKISGMTGTADTEAVEFSKIYNLEVLVIPTNRPIAREDDDDVIFFNEKFKYDAIVEEVAEVHAKGQPVLIGTVSIEQSELLDKLLTRRGIRHEILNAKNHAREALIISEAGAKGSITIATNMAGRGTDIKLGGNPEFRARKRVGTDASEEEFEKALQEETIKWQKDYEEVRSLGGLYILGTERHESRRIDNQLRGRSGRQGDPGFSRFYISLEDHLMRLFARDNVKAAMGRLGMANGEPIYHPWINRVIEKAQSKVEDRNFEIRKHLLEYDDVINTQRTFIYEQRDTILQDPRLIDRIMQGTEDMVDDLLDQYLKKEKDVQGLKDVLKDSFFLTDIEISEKSDPAALRQEILDDLRSTLELKEQEIGKEMMNLVIRSHYLWDIDQKWQEHLEALESLREAVYLRSYAQKNPLVEYKQEGFSLFDELIYEIRTGIIKKIHRVKIDKGPAGPNSRRPIQTRHADFSSFSGRGGGSQQNAPQKVQVVRHTPKVGRNDPCPCGSGKKYKHCHGREG
jgi:preprotein translocase subunit SecA